MNNAKALIPLGFLLALGLVISTYLVTNVARDILMAHQIIKVRGYAEIPVSSRIWQFGISPSKRKTVTWRMHIRFYPHIVKKC